MYKFVENKDKTWTGIGLTEEQEKYQGVVMSMEKCLSLRMKKRHPPLYNSTLMC